MTIMHIYLITCTVNNKVYVGQTIKDNLVSYINNKFWKAEHDTSKTRPFFSAVRKYGRAAFATQSLVETANKEDLNRLEKHYIAMYKSNQKKFGYNATLGGDGPLGHVVSEETRKLLSLAARGKKKKPETKERMRQAAALRTDEYKSALSALANKKRQEKLSPEERSRLAKIGSDAALAALGPYVPKENPDEKLCKTCEVVKPIDCFRRTWIKSKRNPESGRWSYWAHCKDCMNAQRRIDRANQKSTPAA